MRVPAAASASVAWSGPTRLRLLRKAAVAGGGRAGASSMREVSVASSGGRRCKRREEAADYNSEHDSRRLHVGAGARCSHGAT